MRWGADVPYCHRRGGLPACAAWGRRSPRWGGGERFPLVLLHVGRGLSTAQVFAEYDRVGRTLGLDNEALARRHLRAGL